MKKEELKTLIGEDEVILYEGKPDQKCSILESVFNVGLFFAVLTGVLVITGGGEFVATLHYDTWLMFLICLGFSLVPSIVYLIGLFLTYKRFENTSYLLTNKGIYISGGIFSYTHQMKLYKDISAINMHKGMWDRWLKLGDVTITPNVNSMIAAYNPNDSKQINGFRFSINNIKNYEEVYKIIKEQLDSGNSSSK